MPLNKVPFMNSSRVGGDLIELIREYRVVSILGEGGMGVVYLAQDAELGRNVAIKVLSDQLTQDAQFVDRFRNEARLQSSLMHRNIVSLYSFFSDAGRYCMVMEYAEGETLKSVVEREGPMSVERARNIFLEVLDGVGYAHEKGIVHRDLKPSNIMIGAGDRVKIMDFGIAKMLGNHGMTKTGTKVGTLYYMSPEQVRASKDVDHRTDVYSLGVTLFEMLTGKLPFNVDTESDFKVMKEIVSGEFTDVRTYRPEVPEAMATAIRRATVKDRNARVESVDEFRQLLGVERARPPVRSRREKTEIEQPSPAVPTRVVVPVPASRRGVWIGVGIGLVVLVVALVLWIPSMRERHAWDEALRQNSRFSLQQYLQSYPSGTHAAEVTTRLDDMAWSDAIRDGGKVAMNNYVGSYPGGHHFNEAQRRLESIRQQEIAASEAARLQEQMQGTNATGAAGGGSPNGSFFGVIQSSSPAEQEVRSVLDRWMNACRGCDLEEVVSCYNEEVEYATRSVSKSELRSEKEHFFNRFGTCERNSADNVDLTLDTPTRATVTFDNTVAYVNSSSGERYNTTVRKELKLNKVWGNWKIASERDIQ
jgi:serine/threonine protein kinase